MSRRVSGRQLDQIREGLSSRDLAVLRSLREYRLMTGHQIARLHFHDHASPETAGRVCRRVLRRLTNHGLAAHLERRIGGIRAGSSGFIYTLSPVGHRLLGSDSRKRLAEPRFAFVKHTLAIAELATLLVALSEQRGTEVLGIETEPQVWRNFNEGLVEAILKPDLAIRIANADYELSWFVEVDCGTESRPVIQRKCQVYVHYQRSGIEQNLQGLFPKVLWVVPDEPRARQIRSAIDDDPSIDRSLFAVTVFDQAIEALTDFDDESLP